MKVRAILAVALAAAACAPEDIYQSDLTPDARSMCRGRPMCPTHATRSPRWISAPRTARRASMPGRASMPASSSTSGSTPARRPVATRTATASPTTSRARPSCARRWRRAPRPTTRTPTATTTACRTSTRRGATTRASRRRRAPGAHSAATCPTTATWTGTPTSATATADNDGLTDREEAMRTRTEPVRGRHRRRRRRRPHRERRGSSPTDPMSRPPAGSLYVTLPYMDPRGRRRASSTSPRASAARTSCSWSTPPGRWGTITAVRSTLSTMIVPGIVRAIGPGADVRYGMSEHRDFAERRRRLRAARAPAPQRQPHALAERHHPLAASGGGDGPSRRWPRCTRCSRASGCRSTAAPPRGWPPRRTAAATRRPSGGAASARGACPSSCCSPTPPGTTAPPMPTTNFYSSVPMAATWTQLVAEFRRREAYFIGIDVSATRTYTNALALARDSRTLDGAGHAHRLPRLALIGGRQRHLRDHHARAGHPAGRHPPRRRRPHGDPPRRRAPHRRVHAAHRARCGGRPRRRRASTASTPRPSTTSRRRRWSPSR
jgi:hypothetical protein